MAVHSEQSHSSPTFEEEARLWANGYRAVAGVDEAGRGALAGPVVAAALIAPPDSALCGVWSKVRDSKLLRPAEREALSMPIQASAVAWGVGVVEAQVIDEVGIAAATRMAMLQALHVLCVQAEFLLIDWVRLPQSGLPQLSVAKADRRMASVAAASILAKVTRDHLLVELDTQYPRYGFGDHKGYGTVRHLSALQEHGPCPQHRFTFAPLSHSATLGEIEP